jgi:hypothetical protein
MRVQQYFFFKCPPLLKIIVIEKYGLLIKVPQREILLSKLNHQKKN